MLRAFVDKNIATFVSRAKLPSFDSSFQKLDFEGDFLFELILFQMPCSTR